MEPAPELRLSTSSAIRAHAADLWSIPHALRVGGMIPLGTRTTIVRLAGGGLLLHAPASLSEADHAAIAALGPVVALVAPNLEHCSFIADTARRHRDAQLWVAPGVERRLPADLPQRPLLLGQDTARPAWQDDLLPVAIDGMPRLRETVFLHPASGTLITADLSFNIQQADSWLDRTTLRMAGAYGHFGPSHLFKLYFLQDRAAFTRSLQAVLEHDFERVILAHGDVAEQGGKALLRAGFRFLLP